LDKKVWNDLDNQEQKCSDVVREVEKVRDEMVGIISHSLFVINF